MSGYEDDQKVRAQARKDAESTFGASLSEIGGMNKEVIARREAALNGTDPASTRIKESANYQTGAAQAAKAAQGGGNLSVGERAQIKRSAEADSGQAGFTNQQAALDKYSSAAGGAAANSLGSIYGAVAASTKEESSSGGGPCFITTACCELLGLTDDNPILNTFRKFRDEHLKGKVGVSEYYEIAPKILENMEDKNELYPILSEYLLPCYKLIKEEKHEEAYKLYSEMVTHMKATYIK